MDQSSKTVAALAFAAALTCQAAWAAAPATAQSGFSVVSINVCADPIMGQPATHKSLYVPSSADALIDVIRAQKNCWSQVGQAGSGSYVNDDVVLVPLAAAPQTYKVGVMGLWSDVRVISAASPVVASVDK